MEHSETSGIIVLIVGIALMLVTFIVACIQVQGYIELLPALGPIAVFGDDLSPIIEAAIRVLYLGLMGWIASTVTSKGIAVLLQARLLNENKLKHPQNL